VLRTTLVLIAVSLAVPASAQVVDPIPDELEDEYVAPDEIVSFGPETPFDQFVRYVNPLFQRRYGKTLVDPTGRLNPIGFYVTGLPFRDALNLVLARSGLVLRETDRYYLIEPAGLAEGEGVAPAGADADDAVSATDREVRVDAVIFQLNLSRVREVGTNWGSVFGAEATGGDTGGGTGGDAANRLRLFLQTRTFFDALSEVIRGPGEIDIAELNRIFRLLETNGFGRTLSTPSVVVRSGEEGRVQSGSDVPVTIRDFAGNTLTQFISTGVIINAVPEVVVGQDEVGNVVEFVHLEVDVEQSAAQLTGIGLQIDKNQGTTDVLLADGEQVLLGGLYSTEETFSHRGVPLLKDIPLLGYFFGVRTRSVTERELIIVLQASVVDPISDRVRRARPRDLIQQERDARGARLDQTQGGLGQDVDPDDQ
jgi:type IV pilus assembly protein PilQ